MPERGRLALALSRAGPLLDPVGGGPLLAPGGHHGGSQVIAGVDSSITAPSRAQALQAKAEGVCMWGGYLATRSGVGLYATWPQLAFENARLCGGMPLAFCSGWDDPAACAALAREWQVRLCLDVEAGIRGDGEWIQPWLDASGAGLYGVATVHAGRRAAYHVLARYPGYDPRSSWWDEGSSRPSAPCSWQWQGTTSRWGCSVDLHHMDEWFGGTADAPSRLPEELNMSNVRYLSAPDGTQHAFSVNLAGELWVADRPAGANAWATKGSPIAAGLRSLGDLDVHAVPEANQVHGVASTPDGHPLHFWRDVHGSTWYIDQPGW